MPGEPNNESFEVLMESLRAIEEQRTVLGDAINPLIEEITQKAKMTLAAPSDDQIALAESWDQVVSAAQSAGIDTPTPTPEIAETVATVETYKQRLSLIGSVGISDSVEQPKEAVKQPVKQDEKLPTETKTPNEQPEQPQTKAKTPRKQKETKEAVDNIDNKTVLITDGKNTLKPKDSIKKMYVDILRELSQNPEGVVTTEFVRRLTGGFSSRELQLFKTGTKPCPEGVNPDDLRPIVAQFYNAVSKLREKGFISHLQDDNEGQKPTIKAVSSMSFNENDNELKVEIDPVPYSVKFSLVEQTVDNGRGKQVEFSKSSEAFIATAIALGSIATREFSRDKKITMEMVGQLIKDDYGKTISTLEKTIISNLLKEMNSAFDGDFPIEPRGIRGGAHFVFTDGSEINIVNTTNEKLNFDNFINIKFSNLTISIDQEEGNHELINYGKLPTVDQEEIESLLSSYKSFLDILSMLDKDDSVEIDDILKLLGVSKDNYSSTSGRFRKFVSKINDAANEKIINWKRHHNSIVIDVNRRIAISVEDDKQDFTTIELKPTPQQENPTEDLDSEELANSSESEEIPNVAKAHEIVSEINRLDDKIKKTIKGRLVELGRYNYPEKLVEAAYLLHLLTDDSTLAEIRNSDRFNHQDESKFKDFIASAMYVCYIRTMSWGDFGSLLGALKEISPTIQANETRVIVKSFESTTSTILGLDSDRIDSEIQENRQYSERALESLIDGKIPRPNSHRQAIILLDTFRKNRAEIAKGRNKQYFDELVSRIQSIVADTLGKDNFEVAIANRTGKYSSDTGRAVQVTTGAEEALVRTDANRFPDHRSRTRKNKRRRR